MTIKDFIEDFKAKKIQNTRVNENAVSEYIKKTLEVKTYIPFVEKRKIAEMIVDQYTDEIDGIKKHDSISAYVGFVCAMIAAHTNLTMSENPIADYDVLAESGLLSQIVAEFKQSYDECDIILKMALAMELEDNSVNVLVGKFLNGVLRRIDGFADGLKGVMYGLDLTQLLGADFNKEDLAKLSGLLDKIK